MKARLISILFLVTASYAWSAAIPKVATVAVDRNHRDRIIVNFDNPAPSIADSVQWQWLVYEKTSSGSTTALNRVDVVTVDTSGLAPGQNEKAITLFLARPIAAAPTVKQVQILLLTPTDIIQIAPLTRPTQLGISASGATNVFVAAKGRSDSDIYFNGSYTDVLNGDPVYDIDAFVGYMHPLSPRSGIGRIGVYGQARTKMSAVADPNSFLTYLVYQNVLGSGGWIGPFQAPIVNYRLLGSEFDRAAKELTFITSPAFTIPFRPIRPPAELSTKISAWPQFNFTMGSELVDIRKSVLAPTDKWHIRGLIGATLSSGYAPKQSLLDSVQLTSSWQMRLPSTPEIYYDDKFAPIDPSTGKKNPKKTPPMLGTQPRHYFDTKLTYNYAAWGGVTFEHSYGSLPPAFNKTDQSFAFGLTFTLQQASYGRTAILRPQ